MWHQNGCDPIVICNLFLSRPVVVNANREKDPEKKECGKYHQIKKHSLPSLHAYVSIFEIFEKNKTQIIYKY